MGDPPPTGRATCSRRARRGRSSCRPSTRRDAGIEVGLPGFAHLTGAPSDEMVEAVTKPRARKRSTPARRRPPTRPSGRSAEEPAQAKKARRRHKATRPRGGGGEQEAGDEGAGGRRTWPVDEGLRRQGPSRRPAKARSDGSRDQKGREGQEPSGRREGARQGAHGRGSARPSRPRRPPGPRTRTRAQPSWPRRRRSGPPRRPPSAAPPAGLRAPSAERQERLARGRARRPAVEHRHPAPEPGSGRHDDCAESGREVGERTRQQAHARAGNTRGRIASR